MWVQLYCQNQLRWISAKLIGLGIILIVLMIPKAYAARPAKTFTLLEAQEYAVENNYDTLKSQLEVAATQKRIRETKGTGLPQISSSIGYTNNIELPTVLIPDFFNDPNDRIEVQFGTQLNATNSIFSILTKNGSALRPSE